MKTAREFTPASGFHLRTPLLSFDTFLGWGRGLAAAQADAAHLEAALTSDRELQRLRLRELVSTPAFRDALWVASPDLDDAFDGWIANPESDRGQRVERALVKYFSRAAGRATPFGLFAGTSVGRVGGPTDLALAGTERCARYTRIDMDYHFALAAALTKDPGRRAGFAVKPNTSLFAAAGQIRYVESRLAGEDRSYHLVAVDRSDALDDTLTRAADGATADDLAAALVDGDVSRADADAFIAELIDSQILVPDLGLLVTGGEPTRSMADRLARSSGARDAADALSRAAALLDALDAGGLGAPSSTYRAIAALFEALPVQPDRKRLVHVDLVKSSPDAVLGGEALEDVSRAVALLHRLTPQARESELTVFKQAFQERYDQREVPLVEALDEESGIGFPAHRGEGADGSPLLRDLPPLPDEVATTVWGKREQCLLEKAGRALASRSLEIVLDEADLEALAHPSPAPLPDAFAVTVRVAAASTEAAAAGGFRLIVGGVAGASGALLLGRFCHADPEVRRLVDEHLRAEEALQPDAIFAEIVHLPEGRLGNILQRPVLRSHEIVFLGESGADANRRIPITDLLVSLKNGAVHLRSKALGRRVVPRLTSAHNFSLSTLSIYRFLCALQSEGSATGAWSWGALERAPFLPRVVHGRLVLSPAIWNLTKADVKTLGEHTAAGRFAAVQALRADRSLPRFIVVSDYDNDLPVDLDAALSVETFVHLVKTRDQVRVEEMLPGPGDLCAHGPEGRFVHEIIVPFVRTTPRPDSHAQSTAPAVRRSFAPGSEWLYAKLYTGIATADAILLDRVAPLAEAAIDSRAADRWFFIRYADPREHLRVRFHGDPDRLRRDVLPPLLELGAAGMDDGVVWKVQLDTYEREVERYGGPAGIELAEQIFHADSDAAIEMLRRLDPGDAGGEERWRVCLLGLDALLADFGLDAAGKQEVVTRARAAWGTDQREDAALRHALGNRHRKDGREVAQLLKVAADDDHPFAAGVDVLRQRSRRLAPIVDELRRREADSRLVPGLATLALSFMHMHAIRMLRTAAKRQEIVLYELLLRAYKAEVARDRAPRPERTI